MEKTNKKECPKCKSKNVFDRGDRFGKGEDYIPGKPISEPNQPVYECRDCGEIFIYIGKNN
jgi:DNA-directed RNA polymerase subunit RPC12/RpoP